MRNVYERLRSFEHYTKLEVGVVVIFTSVYEMSNKFKTYRVLRNKSLLLPRRQTKLLNVSVNDLRQSSALMRLLFRLYSDFLDISIDGLPERNVFCIKVERETYLKFKSFKFELTQFTVCIKHYKPFGRENQLIKSLVTT